MTANSTRPSNTVFKHVFYSVFYIFVISCNLPKGETSTSNSEKNTFFLKFNPQSGTAYHYNVENKTEMVMEMDDKEIEKLSELAVGMTYRINKDSLNNYLFEMAYDKVQLTTKSDGVETVSNAEKANFSSSGIDHMLGALKESKLVVSVTPGRDINIVSGYEELSKRLMSNLDTTSAYAKQVAQQKIDEVIKGGLVQKNLDQLFKLFPDSAMRIGSKWKIDSKQHDDFNLNISTFYTLNDINDGVAFISSKSTIISDEKPLAVMGNRIVPDLKGEQEGVYQVESSTCMLLNASISSSVKGNIQMGESTIPVSIKLKVNIKGKKL